MDAILAEGRFLRAPEDDLRRSSGPSAGTPRVVSINEELEEYGKRLVAAGETGIVLDYSGMQVDSAAIRKHGPLMTDAFQRMAELESGSIANADEKWMVGHYWLRNPEICTNPQDQAAGSATDIQNGIQETVRGIKDFAEKVRTGKILSPAGKQYSKVLVVGIGGSALGPEFIDHALNDRRTGLKAYFFDNTDPDGMSRTLVQMGSLDDALVIVISKSGGTLETRNGMLEVKRVFESSKLSFEEQAVAITQTDPKRSKLYALAASSDKPWLKIFPMWTWVGGRTSQTSAVGLLPMALQGMDVDKLLEGARLMDEATRVRDVAQNPAAMLALSWYEGNDQGIKRAMVVEPYKDRLSLFSRYLQQLVMESLGKKAEDGSRKGFVVYGNKGSTDQHAYVQQLRDGPDDHFVTFIFDNERLPSGFGAVENGRSDSSGDYLRAFARGTDIALQQDGKRTMTITLPQTDERSLGALIALFERAVGFYGTLIGVNAYHQPGVEAGKKSGEAYILMGGSLLKILSEQSGEMYPGELVQRVRLDKDLSQHLDKVTPIGVYRALIDLEAAGKVRREPGDTISQDLFTVVTGSRTPRMT